MTTTTATTISSTSPIWCIENRGSFASIHVILPPGSKLHCESDAVVTFSGGVEVSGILTGGFFGSLLRVFFGGESFFTTLVENTNHHRDEAQSENVMMAPADPGGIELYRLTPTIGNISSNSSCSSDLLLTSGAYVASDVGVNITTEVQSNSMRNSLLSGTGLFLLRASGQGMVAFAAYGSIHKYELKAGEQRSVDNGHLVAWSASMQYRTGLANANARRGGGGGGGGILASVKSGEGLMCHFTGPGTIFLQSHKPGTEADTVIKRGKSGAKAVAQTGVMIYVFFMIIVLILFVMFVLLHVLTSQSNMQQFRVVSNNNNNNNNAYSYDTSYNGYGSYSYSSSSPSPSAAGRRMNAPQGYRAVGEF